MKNKIKKIITTAVVSAVSLTAIGCGTNESKLAKNIDKSMEDFVSSINNLDYVETASATAPSGKIGKIVETAATADISLKIKTDGNRIQFLNNNISEAEIENTITIPSERTDNFSLFVLTTTPYVSFSSDDNNSVNVKFSTNHIQETSDEIESKINSLIIKRSILMIYVNEIYNGNVNISSENKQAINAYVNVIKENTSFLNGNRGMVKNQLNLASNLVTSETNDNLINYYLIKSSEALETRSNKLDSTISAIDSIIKIIEDNLTTTSTYYQTNLSGTYNNLITKIDTSVNTDAEITENSTNQEIANKIACTLDFCSNKETQENKNITQNQTNSSNANIAETTLNNNINSLNKTTTLTNRQNNRNLLDTQNNTTNQSHNTQNNRRLRNKINTNNANTLQDTRINTNAESQNNIANNNTTINSTEHNNNTNNIELNNPNFENHNSLQNQSNISNESEINRRNTRNRARRIPNSVRKRANNSANTNINSSALDIADNQNTFINNQNELNNQRFTQNQMQNNRTRNLAMQNDDKTYRANRTQNEQNTEEYTKSTTATNDSNNIRASRVPYRASSTSFQA